MAAPSDITGRDSYIVAQALIYSIAHIQSLPKIHQEISNMCDMCAILRAWKVPPFMIRQVELKIGISINLDPDALHHFGVDDYAAELEASR